MGRHEQLDEFEDRETDWHRFGIDNEAFRALCECCFLPPPDSEQEVTVSNVFRAAVNDCLDVYFRTKREGGGNVPGIDDRAKVHRDQIEKIQSCAEALEDALCEAGLKTKRKIANDSGALTQPKPEDVSREAASFFKELKSGRPRWLLDVRSIIDELGDEHADAAQRLKDNRLDWLGHLIDSCEGALAGLEDEHGNYKHAERGCARRAALIWSRYLAYGWGGMLEGQREEYRNDPNETPAALRNEFIGEVLSLAGVEAKPGKISRWIGGVWEQRPHVPFDDHEHLGEHAQRTFYLALWPLFTNGQFPDRVATEFETPQFGREVEMIPLIEEARDQLDSAMRRIVDGIERGESDALPDAKQFYLYTGVPASKCPVLSP